MVRLRQIALVAADLEAAAAEICDALELSAPYEDPGVGKYGLRNQVLAIGSTFLEVVSPCAQNTTAGRLLQKRGGDGGYMVILQVDDAAQARARVAEAGCRIADQFDGEGVSFTHLHPKDIGGAILSLDVMQPVERWEWGGPDWSARPPSPSSRGIVAAHLQGASPEVMAAQWARVIGLPVERDEAGWRLRLEGGEITFSRPTDGRGEGLRGFDVAVADPETTRRRAAAAGRLTADGRLRLSGAEVGLVRAA